VRALAAIVGCDIHPVNNRRILEALRHDFDADEPAVNRWCARWITAGFDALEALLAVDARRGDFCFWTPASSCRGPAARNGTCRSCRCVVDEGMAHHTIDWPGLSRDELTEGWILPCVCEALTDMVITVPDVAR